MPQPYSPDLRQRVLVSCERGDGLRSRSPAASKSVPPPCRTGVARREDGRRKPKPPHSGDVPPRLDASAVQVLRQLVIEDIDALLRAYAERLLERMGVKVCLALICEALKRLNLHPNKRPSERPSRIGPKLQPIARSIASR
jgi:transposase